LGAQAKNMQRKKKTATHHVSQGDLHRNQKKYKKALSSYEAALKIDPKQVTVYDRLIETHQMLDHEWTNEDFTKSLEWTMKKQELENPQIKRIHAKLAPEWKKIIALIERLLQSLDDTADIVIIEQIASYGDRAIYPLIEALLSIKHKRQEP